MARLKNSFNSGEHETQGPGYDTLPAGWYAATITNSEVRENNNKKGSHLWLEFEFIEGAHPTLKGRKSWTRLNLYNQSEQAVQIAEKELATICKHVGVPIVEDTDALHNRPIAIKLKVKPASGDYEARNEISSYDAIGARFKGLTSATAAPTPGVAPAAGAPVTGASFPSGQDPSAKPGWAQ